MPAAHETTTSPAAVTSTASVPNASDAGPASAWPSRLSPSASRGEGAPSSHPVARPRLARPFAELVQEGAARRRSVAAIGRTERNAALATNVSASMAKTQPGSAAATIKPETAGPATWTVLRESASSAFASCSRSAEIVCGTSPVAAGRKNALAAPRHERGDGEHPDLHRAREERNRHQGLNHRPDRVAREHHDPPRQAVGPDAADQDERGAADRQRRKDEAELGGAAPDLEDRQSRRLSEKHAATLPAPRRGSSVGRAHG
jgi:hypothetical protein